MPARRVGVADTGGGPLLYVARIAAALSEAASSGEKYCGAVAAASMLPCAAAVAISLAAA